MHTEDGEIIQECLNGKSQAFGILVDKYREGIYAFVYAELRDFRDAQDVTQEVFLQAYRKLRSLRKKESFAFWLYRIAHRHCIQWFRDRSRRVDKDFIEDQDSRVIDAPALDSHRESQLDESVQEALAMLPDAYREALLLHYFGGLTIKDIARATGASPTAIGKRLSRGRAQLKEEMMAMMDTAFEGQRLPIGFTFRIVESVKHIKINPMPRMAGLPWGLSLAAGIIITVLSLNPHMSIPSDIAIPAGSPLPVETRVLKTGEIPVDILKTSGISVIANKQGDGDGGETQNAFMLAPQQDEGGTWAQKADMPTAKRGHSSSVVNGKIYVIGGTGGVATVEEYDPLTDKWTKKADMPTARIGLSTSAVNGKIYAIGGLKTNPNATLSTVEEYDPLADKWTEKADMPTARMDLSTSAVNGKIYAIGGENVAEAGLSAVEEYDPLTDKWKKKVDMPTPRGNLSTNVVKGNIYAVGGEVTHKGPMVSTVEEYTPEGWTFSVSPRGKLPTKWGEVKSE